MNIAAETTTAGPTPSRLVQVRTKILKENDVVARALRQSFQEAGVYVVSLVSSPGAGKTMFLEKTLAALRKDYPRRGPRRRPGHRQRRRSGWPAPTSR